MKQEESKIILSALLTQRNEKCITSTDAHGIKQYFLYMFLRSGEKRRLCYEPRAGSPLDGVILLHLNHLGTLNCPAEPASGKTKPSGPQRHRLFLLFHRPFHFT